MKNNLNKLSKGLIVTRILLLGFILLTCWITGMTTYKLMHYAGMDESAFTIAQLENYNGTESTWLMLDGVRHVPIDAYDYTTRPDGKTVYKEHLMIDQGVELGKDLIILAILVLLFVMSCSCGKCKSPFNMRSVIFLRIIAVLTLCLALVPEWVGMKMRSSLTGSAATEIDTVEFYMMALALAVGMIAEIFRYGIAVQEDSDSIA